MIEGRVRQDLLDLSSPVIRGQRAEVWRQTRVRRERRGEEHQKEDTEHPYLVRRLDFQVLADGRVYAFLLDHPDLNAALARALGIAPYAVVQISPGQYRGDDGGGNVGTVQVFSASGHARAFLESGVSPGWWFGDIGGRVVALVAFATEEESVRGTVTVWARIDQGVVQRNEGASSRR